MERQAGHANTSGQPTDGILAHRKNARSVRFLDVRQAGRATQPNDGTNRGIDPRRWSTTFSWRRPSNYSWTSRRTAISAQVSANVSAESRAQHIAVPTGDSTCRRRSHQAEPIAESLKSLHHRRAGGAHRGTIASVRRRGESSHRSQGFDSYRNRVALERGHGCDSQRWRSCRACRPHC